MKRLAIAAGTLALFAGCDSPLFSNIPPPHRPPTAGECIDEDGDGSGTGSGCAGRDCDDADPLRYAGAADDVGDDIDQNCDGLDGVDGDADGHASVASGGDDCDDQTDSVHPGASDIVGNATDDNCDGVDGIDGDGDEHASIASGGDDCDDGDPARYPAGASLPGAPELDDGVDQDCDGDRIELALFDGDGDGYTAAYGSSTDGRPDCDDADGDAYPGAATAELRTDCTLDADGDGFADAAPPAGVTPGSDCDDADAQAFPGAADADGAACMLDADGDGWGDAAPPAGITAGTDCADLAGPDPACNDLPGASCNPGLAGADGCDGADNDCDGSVDDDPDLTWTFDADSDGHGGGQSPTGGCTAPAAGFVANADDCADDPTSNPACNGLPGARCSPDLADQDVCDGADNDCDGSVDEDPDLVWYRDADGDGFGFAALTFAQCSQPLGYVADATDCANLPVADPACNGLGGASCNPGKAGQDVCDGANNDCDGLTDEDAVPPAPASISGPSSACSGEAGVAFSVAPVPGATSYTWSVPTGATITGQGTNSVTITFGTTAGNVSVTASNTCGPGPAASTPVTLNTAPAQPGSITGTPTVCSADTGVAYSIATVAGATSYTWSVPSGASITGGQGSESVSVTFGASAGDVSVTANNGCGASVARTLAVAVQSVPATPGTITGAAAACTSEAGVTYSIASVAGATTYAWSVPTGASVTAGQGTTGATVTFGSTAGSVSVTAGNACGTSGASSQPVTLTPLPGQPGSITGASSFCSGQAGVPYSIATVSGATSYNWSAPSDASVTSGQGTTACTVAFGTASGNMQVVAHNTCGDGSPRTLAVSMTAVPAQPGLITGATTVCSGQSGVTYSIGAVSGATGYTWTVPGGASLTGQNTTSITVTFGATGGNVSVTADSGCGSSAARTQAVSIATVPNQPGSISGATNACAGAAVAYSISAVSGATTYTWTGPTGTSVSSGQGTTNATLTLGSTSGNVSVTAGNGCGTSPASTAAVTVTVPPAQPGAISGNSPVCNGTSQGYSIGAVGGATSYTWSVSGTGWSIPTPSTTTSVTTTAGTADGTVTVTANNACPSPPRSATITTLQTPAQPGTISGATSVCQSGSDAYSISAVSYASSYNWSVTPGAQANVTPTSNSAVVDWNATPSGPATVSVSAANLCGTSSARNLGVSVGVPPATPSKPAGAAEFCRNDASNQYYYTYQSAVSSGPTPTSWSWSFPANWYNYAPVNVGNSSTIQSWGQTLRAAGNITATASNGSCSSPTSPALAVRLLPAYATWNSSYGPRDVDTDGAGAVYIGGTTVQGTVSGAFTVTNSTGVVKYWSFLAKLNPDGSSAWVREWHADDNIEVVNVAVASDGSYVAVSGIYAGLTGGGSTPAAGAFTVAPTTTQSTLYHDAYVLVLDGATGAALWFSRWGTGTTSSSDVGGVAIDTGGNVYLSGFNPLAPTGGVITANHCYLAKINAGGGSLAWQKVWNPSLGAYCTTALAIDGTAPPNVFVVGYSGGSSTGDITAPNDFLAKFPGNGGATTWVKTFSGATPSGVAVNSSGEASVVGNYASTVSGDINIVTHTGAVGVANSMLAKFPANGGNVLWTRRWGANSNVNVNDIAVTRMPGWPYESVVVVGEYASQPVSGDLSITTYAGGATDDYAALFDENGGVVWVRRWGINGADAVPAVAVDGFKHISVIGGANGSVTGDITLSPNGSYEAKLGCPP